jgi:CBS-domain-containing membrane protein
MRVANVTVTCPMLHEGDATVGELRAFFRDDHVHMALLVDNGRLVGAVERADLRELPDELPARLAGSLEGRVVSPDTPAHSALLAMREAGRRRLAAVDPDGRLLGLLCLKAAGNGFCSDGGIANRRRERNCVLKSEEWTAKQPTRSLTPHER